MPFYDYMPVSSYVMPYIVGDDAELCGEHWRFTVKFSQSASLHVHNDSIGTSGVAFGAGMWHPDH